MNSYIPGSASAAIEKVALCNGGTNCSKKIGYPVIFRKGVALIALQQHSSTSVVPKPIDGNLIGRGCEL
jgi:hypothetical protein